MKKLTERYVIMLSKQQVSSLNTLRKYDVNVSQFVRQAVKEKLQRDWKSIKEYKERIKLPF